MRDLTPLARANDAAVRDCSPRTAVNQDGRITLTVESMSLRDRAGHRALLALFMSDTERRAA